MKYNDYTYREIIGVANQVITNHRLGGLDNIFGSKETLRDLAYALIEAQFHIQELENPTPKGSD